MTTSLDEHNRLLQPRQSQPVYNGGINTTNTTVSQTPDADHKEYVDDRSNPGLSPYPRQPRSAKVSVSVFEAPLRGPASKDTNPEDTTRFFRAVGWMLERFEPMSNILRLIYTILFANSLILVVFFLTIKFAKPDIFASIPSIAPPADWLLIAANITIIISYSCSSFLKLRICLTIGGFLFVSWAIFSAGQVMVDVLTFNLVMILLNIRHGTLLLYERRYIEFPPEYEQIYSNVFSQYLKRTEFAQLIEKSFIRHMKGGEIFKQQGDLVTSLCVLISGHIDVYRLRGLDEDAERQRRKSGGRMDSDSGSDGEDGNELGHVINKCGPNCFIEAPQWVAAKLNPENYRYEVSFKTADDLAYIKWPRETLVSLFNDNPHLKIAVQAVLGLQTASMLLQSIQMRRLKRRQKRELGSVRVDDSERHGYKDEF